MSDFDEKDVDKYITSDFAPEDVDKYITPDFAPEHSKKISMPQSFGVGLQQGLTLGTADESYGGIGAGLDATQELLNKLGLADPSPSQVGKQLSDKGIKGDIGPKSTLELYNEMRGEKRDELHRAENQHPWATFGGNLAGGALLAGVPAGAALAPFTAAEGATLGARAVTGAANAIPAGFLAGVGSSESDDLTDIAKSGVLGAGVGMAVGGAIPPVIAGLKVAGAATGRGAYKVAKPFLPETTQTAVERGQAGIDTTGEKFYNDVNKGVLNASGELSIPVIEQAESQVAAHAKNLEDIDKQIGDLFKQRANAKQSDISQIDDKIMKLQSEQARNIEAGRNREISDHALEMQKTDSNIELLKKKQQEAINLEESKQIAQNASDVKRINNKTVETAKQMQEYLGKTKDNLRKTFDKIDSSAESTGIAPKNSDVIDNFVNTIRDQAGIPENEANLIEKKLSELKGKTDIQSFRILKASLNKYFENANPVIRRSAKQAYSSLKNNYTKELRDNNFNDLANKMEDTNKRWGAIAELEDKFTDNLSKDRITSEIEASPDTINAINNFANKDPKQIAKSQFMSRLMTKADPENAGSMVDKLNSLAQETQLAKEFKPDISKVQTPNINKNLSKLEQLRAEYKKFKPSSDKELELPNPELERLKSTKEQLKVQPEVNPEIERLQALQEQYKQLKPSKIEGLDLPTEPTQLKNELTTLLPKFNAKTGNDISEKKLSELMNFLEQKKGSDYVNSTKQKLTELNKDVALRNSQTGADQNLPLDLAGAAKKIIGNTNKVANKFGQAIKPSNTEVKTAQHFLQNGVDIISKSSPENITAIADQMGQIGGDAGKHYSDSLKAAMSKTSTAKFAAINALIQQPEFRKLYHKITGTNFGEADGQ